MKQQDYRNSMVVLRTLAMHYRQARDPGWEPLSIYQVYRVARDAGTGWLRSWDIAHTFGRGADRLVEVGLAIPVPTTSHDRAYVPSPIGVLVFAQHPTLFPRPQAARNAPGSSEAGEHWRGVIAGFGIALAIAAGIFDLLGATVLAGWLLCFSAALIVLYFAIPHGRFRMLR